MGRGYEVKRSRAKDQREAISRLGINLNTLLSRTASLTNPPSKFEIMSRRISHSRSRDPSKLGNLRRALLALPAIVCRGNSGETSCSRGSARGKLHRANVS